MTGQHDASFIGSRNHSFRNSIRNTFHYRDKSLNSTHKRTGSTNSTTLTATISPPIPNGDITPTGLSYRGHQRTRSGNVINNNPNPASPLPLTPNIPQMENYSPEFDPKKDSKSKRSRSSLLKAPPMKDVWLDDDEDEDVTITYEVQRNNYNYNSYDSNNDNTKKRSNTANSTTNVLGGLRRFGSQKRYEKPSTPPPPPPPPPSSSSSSVPIINHGPPPIDTSKTSPPRNRPAGGYHKHSSSKISLSSIKSSNHSRSSSKRIFSFMHRSDSTSGQKIEISAPSNFKHTNHVDADYLKGSSSDKELIRSTSLRGVVGSPTVREQLGGGAPAQQQQPPAPPKRSHNHKHEDSLGSFVSQSTKSTNRPISSVSSVYGSTPVTSGSPSPALSNYKHQNVDKKNSVESFGSWAASPNSGDFLEQQKWLLHSTDSQTSFQDSLVNRSYSQAYNYSGTSLNNAYACYSPNPNATAATTATATATATATPNDQMQWVSGSVEERRSVLLPAPNLPMTAEKFHNRNIVPLTNSVTGASVAATNLHMTSGQMLHHTAFQNSNSPLIYNSSSNNSSRRALGKVDETNEDFEWF